MLESAYRLSSSWEFFTEECTRLENVFSNFHYPKNHINRIVNRFVKIARIALPFKDQKAADNVRRQLYDLGYLYNILYNA